MAELKINDVHKVYPNGVVAIRGVDLAIADGEFIVLVGPSGCGKSTLLRMIAGLEEISAGEIHIGNRLVNRLEPADRDIAMVFQNYALYPHMSVFDNMAYGLKNRKTPKDEIQRRVADAAALLGIGHLLDRRPRQLSGGQRQRVAMGRAIVRKPAAFLFDEPLSNLDAKLRVQMRVEVRRLQRRLGTTSIYVTHDQVEAMTMADRLVVMDSGIAQQVGTPRELYQKPANTFVAGFIGSPAMNLLKGALAGSGESVQIGATRLTLPTPLRAQPAGTSDLTVGIRPEDLHIAPDNGQLSAQVELVEHLGTDTLLHLRADWAGEELVQVKLHGDQDFSTGGELRLSVEPSALHLFDSSSGKRLN
ncbi:MAG: sn-glycerol-3-phosphate import ATP-binding protein UgpC [Hyphomicrobiaceae bacterium]